MTSRGGKAPENHMIVDALGDPVHFMPTGSQINDSKAVLDFDLVRAVLDGHCPVCVAADGLPVFDDVGRICGYIDFLTTIHLNEDEEERGQAREWAGSLGWTGRAVKP